MENQDLVLEASQSASNHMEAKSKNLSKKIVYVNKVNLVIFFFKIVCSP